MPLDSYFLDQYLTYAHDIEQVRRGVPVLFNVIFGSGVAYLHANNLDLIILKFFHKISI